MGSKRGKEGGWGKGNEGRGKRRAEKIGGEGEKDKGSQGGRGERG